MGSWASKHKLFLAFQVYHTTGNGRYSKNPFSDSKKDRCSNKAGALQLKCTFQIKRRPPMAIFKKRQQEKRCPWTKSFFSNTTVNISRIGAWWFQASCCSRTESYLSPYHLFDEPLPIPMRRSYWTESYLFPYHLCKWKRVFLRTINPPTLPGLLVTLQ